MNDTFWIQHVFGRSLAEKTNRDDAKLATDILPVDALGLMTRIFTNCGSLLTPFTDIQVAEGLVFLGSAGESDWMYYPYDSAIDRHARLSCIRSIETLYRDCFARRCRNETTHLSSHLFRLNSVCYMWWDVFPSGLGDPEGELIEVMAKALQIEHAACQESALHGLGHWETENESRVHQVVDEWLAAHPHLPPPLRAYAEAARNGDVQ